MIYFTSSFFGWVSVSSFAWMRFTQLASKREPYERPPRRLQTWPPPPLFMKFIPNMYSADVGGGLRYFVTQVLSRFFVERFHLFPATSFLRLIAGAFLVGALLPFKIYYVVTRWRQRLVFTQRCSQPFKNSVHEWISLLPTVSKL